MNIQQMPPEMSKAITRAMISVQRIAKGDENKYDNYRYTSVDDFFDSIRPILAENGLAVISDEVENTGFNHVEYNKQAGRGTEKRFSFFKFAFYIVHEQCEQLFGPLYRTVELRFSGPQTAGQAQSYAEKQFLRSLLKVATGEVDADQKPQAQTPTTTSHDIPLQTAQGALRTIKEGKPDRIKSLHSYISDMQAKGFKGPNLTSVIDALNT